MQDKSWSQVAQGSNDQAQNKENSHRRSASGYLNSVSNARIRRYRSIYPTSQIPKCPLPHRTTYFISNI